MNVFVALLLVVVSSSVAIAALLLARRRAPEGSHFQDGDRAAGVFGVLATGFSVLLGLVVVLAFTVYDDARSGAATEARTVSQQSEVAYLLPPATGRQLAAELICYGRSVVHQEWPQMEDGEQLAEINPWGVQLFRTLSETKPRTATEQAAYSKWLDQRFDRETARSDRIHGASGVIPTPLWLVLWVSAVVIVGFMLLFADSAEAWFAQAAQIGSVVVVIVSTMLLIRYLDNPYRPGIGSVRPVAMERTLEHLDQQRRLIGDTTPIPCDERGRAISQ